MSMHNNNGLFYDAYYSTAVESTVTFLARQIERPRLARLNLHSMAGRAYCDSDGYLVEKLTEAAPVARSFPIAEYEPFNKDCQPFVPLKPTLPSLQSALGSISYDIFGFPTHRQQSRCLPGDCFLPDSQSLLGPSGRIISRPSHPDEMYNKLEFPVVPVQLLEEASAATKSTVNPSLNEDVRESNSSDVSTVPVKNLTESSLLITGNEVSSGDDNNSTVDTLLSMPLSSAPDPIASDETIKNSSDVSGELSLLD